MGVFPLPAVPMTLWQQSGLDFRQDGALKYAYDGDGLYRGWLLVVYTDPA